MDVASGVDVSYGYDCVVADVAAVAVDASHSIVEPRLRCCACL
jgi:hypothetical protein